MHFQLKTVLSSFLLAGRIGAVQLLPQTLLHASDPKPTFDAVSIRQIDSYQRVSASGSTGYFFTRHEPCVYTAEKVHCQLSLEELIREAYQRKRYEIDGPKWLGEDVFVFEGLLAEKTSRDNAYLMMQRALEDRFGLKIRSSKKIIEIYAIVADPKGAHLVPAASLEQQKKIDVRGGPPSSVVSSEGRFTALAIRLDDLGRWIERVAALDRPVLNRSGLDGRYKVDLTWPTDDISNAPQAAGDAGIIAALRKTCGLILRKQDESVEMLNIEHVDRQPTPN